MPFTDTIHTLSEFVDQSADQTILNKAVTYWYEGHCPRSNRLFRLPRTVFAEKIAEGLMHQLAEQARFAEEGKMYGVLLVETQAKEQRVLQAFSGLLQSESYVKGWVPPIPGHEHIRLEEIQTLEQLNTIKQQLIELAIIPERQEYTTLLQAYETRLSELKHWQQIQKQERQQQRQQLLKALTGESLDAALELLDEQSRQAGIIRRQLKQERDTRLLPLKQVIQQADDRIRQLRLRRKALSRHLQSQMHKAYHLTNFAGESAAIQQLALGSGLPTGTGDCCAPKLLHYAAAHNLKPLAMAEFWWGTATDDKISGEFYGACTERCQPILGFLLSGLPQPAKFSEARTDHSLPVLYEDDWLIAIDKPTGLLSVPGRYFDKQDSVLNRLRQLYPDLLPLHRLDQDTSGILLLAKDRATHRALSQQFQQRQLRKVYEAILVGKVTQPEGTVDLPLRPDLMDRPRQVVDLQHGKPSISHFRVLTADDLTRVEWTPITGRTHQLRVHAATGLGTPILGDRLYGQLSGQSTNAERLHLHARELQFLHPQSGQMIRLQSTTPF